MVENRKDKGWILRELFDVRKQDRTEVEEVAGLVGLSSFNVIINVLFGSVVLINL
jgi:hypothetical protein